MRFKGIRKWLAKRKAIKHMKHSKACGNWHEVKVTSGVIYCTVCHRIFWSGVDKKAMTELREDARLAARVLDAKATRNELDRRSKQELVNAIEEITNG